MHWSKRHRETKDWEKRIKYEGFSGSPPKHTTHVDLKIISNRKRKLDADNLVGGCKPVLDALKRLGVIVDDSPKWLDTLYEQHTGGDINTVIHISTEGGYVSNN
jgi:Holliday junction resolvase RusA-like endonuclease